MTELAEIKAELAEIKAMLRKLSLPAASLLSVEEKGDRLTDIIAEYGYGSPEYKDFVKEMNGG